MNRRLLIFVLFTAAYFLSYFYRSANAVIAPDLAQEMALNAGQLGLMTSLFFATFAAMQIPLGVALDRYGARWVTPLVMLAAVAGSILFAHATSFGHLALGRALIGVGMAGVLMGSLKIFSQWFAANRFATMSGLLVGIGSMGALLAATPLAQLNQAVGWRVVFAVAAGITAVSAIAIMVWARNAPPGTAQHAGSGEDGGLTAVFRSRDFWRIAPMTFFVGGTLLSFQGLWAGPYLFDVLRLGEVQGGNVLLALSVGATVGYTTSGWLTDRFGLARTLRLIIAIFLLCQMALALRPSLPIVAVVYAVFGFTGGFNVMLLAQTRRLFPLSMTGKAVTAVNLFGIGGTFLLQWWGGVIVGQFAPDAAGHYPPLAYTAALLFTAVGGLLAFVWYWPVGAVRD